MVIIEDEGQIEIETTEISKIKYKLFTMSQ